MIILGVDPGYATVGFGFVQYMPPRYKVGKYGAVVTPAGDPFEKRLNTIHTSMCNLIERFSPDALAIEKLFYNNNAKTVIGVAEARGVILLAAYEKGVPVFEYTPLQVKLAVTGFGQALKPQVQEMTKRLLALKEMPKPDDTADALALAICHAQNSSRVKLTHATAVTSISAVVKKAEKREE